MRAGDFRPIPARPPQTGTDEKARHTAGLNANTDLRMQFARVNGYQHCCRCTFAHSRTRMIHAAPSLASVHFRTQDLRSGDLRVRDRTFAPPRRVRLTKLHRIARHARKTGSPVIGNHGLHAFITVRAAGRIHRQCSISNKTPHWNKGSAAAFTIAFLRRRSCRQLSTASCKPIV